MHSNSKNYSQLQPEERVTLASLKQQHYSIRAMARMLKGTRYASEGRGTSLLCSIPQQGFAGQRVMAALRRRFSGPLAP